MRRVIVFAAVVLLLPAVYAGRQAYDLYATVKDATGIKAPRTKDPIDRKVTPVPFNQGKRFNILVLGSDNDKKKEEAKPPSQSMIVVTVDPLNHKVGMLSIPRDFWINIPGHGMAKIQVAYKYGGVSLARDVVERYFHIPIDYYAWIGLEGFIRVLNTFGGVTLDVSHPILDDSYPDDLNSANPYAYRRIFIPAGWQHMNGEQALEYVRSRHGDRIGDFGRSARQQQVLLELKKKVTTFNLLRNITAVASDLKNNVRTDLTLPQLYQLQKLAKQIQPQDITQVVLSVPTYSSYATSADGQDIVVPRWRVIRPVVHRMFAPVPTPTPQPTASPTSPPTSSAAKSTPAPTASRTVTQPTVRPIPTSAPTPTPLTRLPGNFLFVRRGNLFEVRPDHSIRQLTSTGDVAMPSLSPDGKTVAVVRFADHGNATDVWLLNRRTLRLSPVTRDVDQEVPFQVQNDLWAAWPTWSPDGKSVIISWDAQKRAQAPSDGRPTDLALWLMPGNGGPGTQLTVPSIGAGGDVEPSWRPRANQIVFVHWDYIPQTNQPYSQLELRDLSTGQSTPLTPVGGRVLSPAWDAAGQRLVFIRRQPDGTDELVITEVRRSGASFVLGPRTVLARGAIAQPAFTPGGRFVSFLRADGDGFAAYLVRSSGGRATRIDDVGSDVDARWRPIWGR